MENGEIKKCRVCGSGELEDLFGIGDIHLSTFVEKEGDSIGKSPLDLAWCNGCTLVQLRYTAPQELMYSGHYWYRSGLNDVIIKDLEGITRQVRGMVELREGDVVLDIGANDGTLLGFYPREQVRVGVEPATNLTDELRGKADVVIPEFWDYERYKEIVGKKAKIITAIGMFYDMDDPGKFIRDCVSALDERGVFVAQLMTSKPMLENNDVGNICHEHLEYYSYGSLRRLFEMNGLEIFRVEENGINGGSYRLHARHLKKGSMAYPERVTKQDFMDFGRRIAENRDKCRALLGTLKREGKRVYGYGASTKGNTILQYYGLSRNELEGIAEIHPEKIGKMTVGTHIPIVGEKEARQKADYFLVLPYAFRDSFIKREEEWMKKGGHFIFTTPKVEVVGV